MSCTRSGVHLPIKHRIVRGTKRQLRQFCKHKNLPSRWIRQDGEGFFVKLSDRGRGRNNGR